MGVHHCEVCGVYIPASYYITDYNSKDYCAVHGQLLFEKYEDYTRQRPPSEEPKAGERILIEPVGLEITSGTYYPNDNDPPWSVDGEGRYKGYEIIGWWPIGHLVKKGTHA